MAVGQRIVRAHAALALWLLGAPAWGQTALSPQPTSQAPLTLALAIQQAEANYPAIRAAQERQEAARDAIAVAKTAYLPRADLLWQTSRATTNRPNVVLIPQPIVPVPAPPARATTGHSDWNSATGVLLGWQPFDFGQRGAQVGVARFGFESTRHASALTKLNVAGAAAQAFLDVVAARQQVTVQQANVDRMEAFAKNVHVLVDNTLRPGADASQADAQLARARTQLIQAQAQEQVAQEALANLLQIPALQISIDDQEILAGPPSSDLPDASIEAHPAVEQQSAILNEQKQQLHWLNRSYAPVFNLYGSVSGLGAGLSSTTPTPAFQGGTAGLAPNELNWVAALQVTFPAFQIFSLHDQKKAQKATVSSTEAVYKQTVSDLSAQEKEARAALEGTRRVAANTPVEVSAARESEQQQEVRYKSGLATVVDVSTAQAALAQAEGDDALARVNVWRALAALAEAHGDMTPFVQILEKHP